MIGWPEATRGRVVVGQDEHEGRATIFRDGKIDLLAPEREGQIKAKMRVAPF